MTSIRHRVPFPAVSPVGIAAVVAALAAMFGLLTALLMVARQAVQQGDSRRRAVVMLADAAWHCEALRDSEGRARCLARLPRPHALPQDDAGLRALVRALEAAAAAEAKPRR